MFRSPGITARFDHIVPATVVIRLAGHGGQILFDVTVTDAGYLIGRKRGTNGRAELANETAGRGGAAGRA